MKLINRIVILIVIAIGMWGLGWSLGQILDPDLSRILIGLGGVASIIIVADLMSSDHS